MRRIQKTMLAGLAMLGLAMTGCDDNGTDSDAVEPSALVGRWNITSMHEEGWRKYTAEGEQPVKEDVDESVTPPAGTYIEFMADSTFILHNDFPVDGTWSVEGSTIVAVSELLGYRDTTEYEATLNGNQGTFVSRKVTSDDFDGTLVESDITSTIKASKAASD